MLRTRLFYTFTFIDLFVFIIIIIFEDYIAKSASLPGYGRNGLQRVSYHFCN